MVAVSAVVTLVGPAHPWGLEGKKLAIKKLRAGTKLVFTAYDFVVDPAPPAVGAIPDATLREAAAELSV